MSDEAELWMGQSVMAGAARLVLVEGAHLLHPEPAVFEAMAKGWRRQQESRLLAATTVDARDKIIRRFQVFCDEYPWRCGGLDRIVAVSESFSVHDPRLPERVGDVHGLCVRRPLRLGGGVRGTVR